MSNEELDNLIAAFLSGEMDDAAREAFAARLEADPAAMSAFDDALRLELLLRAAHDEPANVASERQAAEKLTEKVKQMQPAKPAQAAAPNRAQRPRLIKRPSRPTKPLTFRAWMALAAAVALMFGMAFYFIYGSGSNTGGVSTSGEKKGATKQKFSVASGHVWIDGRDVREVGENEWVNVAAESSATLATNDGSTITLEAGTSALLRPRGVTLLSGAGRFAVKPGKDLFLLETPAGSVNSSGGEFDARLQTSSFSNEGPQNRRMELGLSVSVSSGSAQVDFDGTTTRLAAGESREFSSHQKPIAGDTSNRRPRDDGPPIPPGPGLMGPPRELKVIDAIIRREKDLSLTDAQKSALRDSRARISEHFGAMGRDPELRDLFIKQREAADAGDNAASRRIHDRIRARTDKLIEAADLPGNPLEILTLKQKQLMRDELEELRPPPRRGPPGREPRDDDGPPPPRPPPPPPPRGKQ